MKLPDSTKYAPTSKVKCLLADLKVFYNGGRQLGDRPSLRRATYCRQSSKLANACKDCMFERVLVECTTKLYLESDFCHFIYIVTENKIWSILNTFLVTRRNFAIDVHDSNNVIKPNTFEMCQILTLYF